MPAFKKMGVLKEYLMLFIALQIKACANLEAVLKLRCSLIMFVAKQLILSWRLY